MRLALIDHYDSFTFNVIDWLERDLDVRVVRIACDDENGLAGLAASPLPLVLSPGPKRPEDAVQTLALAQKLLGKVPILGVCLGHQLLAHLAGGRVVAGVAPFHGSTREIRPLAGEGLFAGFQGAPFRAATYNSLVVDEKSLRAPWRVTARCDRGEIQAIAREVPGEAPAFGIQFHPESFLSENAALLCSNWLRLAKP